MRELLSEASVCGRSESSYQFSATIKRSKNQNLMEVTKMTRLTIIGISFLVISLMFVGQSYAEINPDTVLGAWLLDEGTGSIAVDATGNGNDGTL